MGKLDIHDRMLQQCGSYSFSSAKCSVESDRPLIETLVSELWEGSTDPISEFNRFVNQDLAAHMAAEVELGPGVSVPQQLLTNSTAWIIGILGIYPTTYP